MRRRPLGYFAPAANRASIDLGPEGPWTTPQGRQERQEFNRGINAMLTYSRRRDRPDLPVGPGTDPALRDYQESLQYLTLRNPRVAGQLQQEAAIMGRMADLRVARGMFGKRPPGVSGLGYIMVPAAPPGHSYAELAWIGAPTRIRAGRRRGIF